MDEKKMNVLIIEDNPADARLVREILKEGRGNFTTSVVERLKESSKLLASRDIDLVLLDLNLPDSQGLITFTELQNRFPHIPIVVQTSIDNEELGQQAVRLGAQDYIVKGGVDAELLRRSLAYAIERKRAQEALLTERDSLRDSQRAALNIMEDAITVRRQAEVLNIELKREIAERKKAQEEIKKLARFPAENPNPVLRFSQDGRILFSNGPGGVLLEKWNSRVGDIVPPQWQQIIGEVLKTRKEKVRDIEFGERIYLTVVVPVSEGKYVNLYGRDVTKERHAQEALQKAHDELEIRVKERTAELQRANEQLTKEIKERVRTEQSLRLEEARLDTLLRLSQMSEEPLDEITGFTLGQAIALTHSKIGFLGFLDEEETIYTLHSVSKDVVEECNVPGNPMHWPVADAGIWADAIRQHKTLFVNDYSKPNPRKKGIPPGHVPIVRFMVVPVFEGEKIVALAGVGNKARDYDKSDERQITLLLNGMWACTQKNRAQEALRSSALYMRALLEASLDPLVTISHDGKIIDVNVATETATGLSRESLVGTNFSDCFTEPENAQRVFEKVLSEGQIKNYPLTIKHISGNTTDVLYNATIYKNEAGQVQGIFAAARDITESKKAENRSRLTNLLLELFARKTTRKEYLDSVVDAIHNWSGCRCVGIRLLNDNDFVPFESCMGFEDEFLAQESMLSIKTDVCLCIRAITQQKQSADIRLATSRGSFRSDNTFEFIENLPKNLKKLYRGNCIKHGFKSLAVVPIRYRDNILGAIHLADKNKNMVPVEKVETLENMAMLIGEAVHRFEIEESLRSSEIRLLEAQRLVHLGNWEWDIIKNKIWWSDEVYQIFGIEPRQFDETYETFLSYIHPDDRKVVEKSMKEALYEGKIYSIDHRVVSSEGDERIIHGTAEVIYDTNQKPAKMIGTVQDVTDQKKAEEEIRYNQQQLRSLTAQLHLTEEMERRRIASDLHDSVGQILAFARREVLALHKATPEKLAVSLNEISNKLNQAIEQTRTLSFDLSPNILYDLGFEVAVEDLIEKFAKERKIQYQFNNSEEQKPLSDAVKILLYRSIRELLINIEKHAKAKLIKISLTRTNNDVHIIVEDDGKGFDLSILDNRRGRPRGFGIFSIRERLNHIGGRFKILSDKNKGTKVILIAPLNTKKGVEL